MYAATRALVCLVLLAAPAATADTFYRYHDGKTGRDVFVNRLEQIPQKYRQQVTVVFDSGSLANRDQVEHPAPVPPPDQHLTDRLIKELAPTSTATPASPANTAQSLWRQAALVAANAADAKLVRAGGQPLVAHEREHLGRIVLTAFVLLAVAGLGAFAVWVVLVVRAFREQRFGWAVAMILFWPLGYLYLLLHFGQGRPWLKSLATLGYLSPSLVALWTAWKVYAWFHAVVQARGGHL